MSKQESLPKTEKITKPEIMKVPDNLKWDGEAYLKFQAKRHDARFGDVSIFLNQRTKERVMVKEKSSTDRKQFTVDVHMAMQRMHLQNDNLHRMLAWGTMTKKELCSTHHYVKMFFEFPQSDIRNEVASRKKAGEALSDMELSDCTSNCLHGLDYLHNRKLAHGDIRPMLLSCDRVNGSKTPNQFKLLDRLGDPSQIEKNQINNLMNSKQLYMSPQLYKFINAKNKKTRVPYNRQKNDLFALGMSIISAGNGTSVKDCYKKGGEFDKKRLKQHLDRFREKHQTNYSLCNVVSNLVEYDENTRPDTNMLLGREPMVINQKPPMQMNIQKKKAQPVITQKAPPVEIETIETQVEVHQQRQVENYQERQVETYQERQVETYQERQVEVSKERPVQVYRGNQERQVESYQERPVQVYQERPVQTLKKSPSQIKTGENVSYGEPQILRTYVDESSRRSYRGEDKSVLMAPRSPRHKTQGFQQNEQMKKSTSVKPENFVNSVPLNDQAENSKIVKRTVFVMDNDGNVIDKLEKTNPV